MFTIIGGDGKEYGPVSADNVRAWITAGRANLDTKARTIGSEEWRRLGDYPEFAPMPARGLPPAVPGMPEMPAQATPTFSVPTDMPDLPALAPSTELAGRGERLLAQLIDNVVTFAACIPGLIMIGLAALKSGINLGLNSNVNQIAVAAGFGAGLIVLCIGGLIVSAVQIYLLVTRGQTIGKKAMGIRIVTFDDESNPGFVKVFILRAIVPAILGMAPYLGPFFTLTDICFIFREDQRCIHDMIAGTKVIKG